MKNDEIKYEKVYKILKYKIECGLLPGGTKLPSRSRLCQEFDTSEKTVRRSIQLLAEEGLVETLQRRRPTVVMDFRTKDSQSTIQKARSTVANDFLQTGILLCYPVNRRGMFLCKGEEWNTPETIVENMDPHCPKEFWRLSNRFWRYFICRNENEFIVRAVDSLGFSELDPLSGTLEMRKDYHSGLKKLICTMKQGGIPETVYFDDLYVLYGFQPEEEKEETPRQIRQTYLSKEQVKDLEYRLCKDQERYSGVYLDLLGLIAVGRYKLGERLPSHDELRKIYHVSIDTTIKAIQILESWGVVTATRGKGIYVTMDLEELRHIPFDMNLVACHVRRFLDTLELLSLTVEGVADHAVKQATKEEAETLLAEIDNLWNGPYLYQLSPLILLDFLVEHIRYGALRGIYEVVRKNYHIGRSIPLLVNREKIPTSTAIYNQSMKAAGLLVEGDLKGFVQTAAAMFQNTHRLVVAECKRLGYFEPAMKVYDGEQLWK